MYCEVISHSYLFLAIIQLYMYISIIFYNIVTIQAAR